MVYTQLAATRNAQNPWNCSQGPVSAHSPHGPYRHVSHQASRVGRVQGKSSLTWIQHTVKQMHLLSGLIMRLHTEPVKSGQIRDPAS
jgi:hypothetical protein